MDSVAVSTGGSLPYLGYIGMCREIERIENLKNHIILKSRIIFAPFGIVFPVLSLDRVAKFFQLK